jgi:hypothetical protein
LILHGIVFASNYSTSPENIGTPYSLEFDSDEL